MEGLKVPEVIGLAQDSQWRIELIEDPMEAALVAGDALTRIKQVPDSLVEGGHRILANVLGAYALRHWLEDEQRYALIRFDQAHIEGNAAGIGFLQNIYGNFRLQTLFLAVRDVHVLEIVHDEDEDEPRTIPMEVSSLAIPVLQLDALMSAA